MILQERMKYGGGNVLTAAVYVLIVISCTLIGFLYGENYRRRVVELNEIQRAVVQLQNEIMYTYTPLPEAIRSVSIKSIYPLNDFFMLIYELLSENRVESVYEAFRYAVNSKKQCLALKKEDINILTDMAKTLGQADIDGHRRVFELTNDTLKKRIGEAESSMQKNVKMFRSIGFCIGAMLVIMLI